mgnify:CR=1 FL=1
MEKQEQYVTEFLESLTPQQKKSYEVAKSQLGDTFDLLKSNVFIEYMQKREEKKL